MVEWILSREHAAVFLVGKCVFSYVSLGLMETGNDHGKDPEEVVDFLEQVYGKCTFKRVELFMSGPCEDSDLDGIWVDGIWCRRLVSPEFGANGTGGDLSTAASKEVC